MIQKKLIAFCVIALNTFFAYSQSKFKNEISLKSDNDAYLAIAQDKYYTNGLFFSYKTALNTKSKNIYKKTIGFTIGQKMYNPYSGSVEFERFIDRPFAGYLYASSMLNWFYKNESSLKVELQFGTIGPSSLAQDFQKFYHKLFGFYNLNGWQYQIGNEFGINSIISTHNLLYRSNNKKSDFSIPSEIRLGNTFTGAKTGILFRTGKINPLYHSNTTESLISSTKNNSLSNKEFYFYLKPALDIIIYDATISGGLFKDYPDAVTFSPKRLVFSQTIGANYSSERVSLGFSLIFKSTEIKSYAKPDQYGTIDLSYRF